MKIKGQRVSKKLSALGAVLAAVTTLGITFDVGEVWICLLDALLGMVYILSQAFVDGREMQNRIPEAIEEAAETVGMDVEEEDEDDEVEDITEEFHDNERDVVVLKTRRGRSITLGDGKLEILKRLREKRRVEFLS